jgi:[amino group carrier protein]-L-2-aminoadipate 6-kinase
MGPLKIVVKCGGHGAVDTRAVARDVAGLLRDGHRIVLVHGGSAAIAELTRRLGIEQRDLTSPSGVSTRYTDDATLEAVVLALAGSVKPRLVTELARCGAAAVGLTGIDGGMLRARRKGAQRRVVDGRVVIVRDNHSGRIVHTDGRVIELLTGAGMVPVVSPPVLDENGDVVNADADRVAAAVAGAVGADALVLLSGVPGVLADPGDEGSLMPVCTVERGGGPPSWARAGMSLKLVAAREALSAGVGQVLIGDGRVAGPVRRALAGGATRVLLADPGADEDGGGR